MFLEGTGKDVLAIRLGDEKQAGNKAKDDIAYDNAQTLEGAAA